MNLLFRWTDDKRGRRRLVTDHKSGMHALRHCFASITLADGVNIKELSEYLGHTDPGFTLRVDAHMLPSSHDRARIAVDKPDAPPARRIPQCRRNSDAVPGAPTQSLTEQGRNKPRRERRGTKP